MKNIRVKSSKTRVVQQKIKSGSFKTLSFAALAGLAFLWISAYAGESSLIDLSQKPVNTPTLDYLKKDNVVIQGAFVPDTEVKVYRHIISDDDGNLYDLYSIKGIDADPDAYKNLLNSGVNIQYVDGGYGYTSVTFSDLGASTFEEALEKYKSTYTYYGSKTGYNFEFQEGKFIVQPIMFLSYTFINTFDYTMLQE